MKLTTSDNKSTVFVYQNTSGLPMITSSLPTTEGVESTTDSSNATRYDDEDEIDDIVLKRIKWSFKIFVAIVIVLLVMMLYKNISKKRKNKTYDSLSFKHLMFSILHAFFIDPPTSKMTTCCDALTTELQCVLEISVPIWTACVALKMFTDLYLFGGRGEGYTAADFTVFGFGSIATLHVYELFFITLGSYTDEEVRFPSAVRLSCVLLIIAVSIAIACVIIKSLCSESDLVKTIGLFYLLHLVVFIVCDVCLAWFIVVQSTSATQGNGAVVTATVLLYGRMVMEIIWFVGSHYLGKTLRIYSPN